ncbi:MAG: hypothetical protein ACLTTU_11095 [Bilophila wadsworthia]
MEAGSSWMNRLGIKQNPLWRVKQGGSCGSAMNAKASVFDKGREGPFREYTVSLRMIGFNADVAELIQHTLPDAKRKTGNFRGHIVVFRFIQNQFQCRAVAAATSGFNAERTFGTSS